MLVLEGFLNSFPKLVFLELGFTKLVSLSYLLNRVLEISLRIPTN